MRVNGLTINDMEKAITVDINKTQNNNSKLTRYSVCMSISDR